MIRKLIEKYSGLITSHPVTVLIIMLLVSAFAIHTAGTIETKKSDIKSMLPKDVDAIATINDIENEFGSTNAVFFAIEIDPEFAGSDEIRDIRDPQVIRYSDQLAELALHTEKVIDATGPATVLRNINNGRIPQSIREVSQLADKNGLLDNYISRDYSLALVRIKTTDDVDLKALEVELNKILMQIPKPPGIRTTLGGTAMESTIIEKSIGPDMAKTSLYSLIGILIIILVLFRSIKYGFTPMTTIIFGTLWAMGYVGLIGMGLSSQTSGVLSMIMGIGIDFGIQVVTRYRFEMKNLSGLAERHPHIRLTSREAMAVTLNNVIVPMSTTTLAALIGFQAMSLGKLTFLGDMGTIMSYGVAASMVAAITIVPALVIIIDTMNIKEKFGKFTKKTLGKNMKKLLTQIAVFCIMTGFILVLANPAGSAPLKGVQGSRVQAYFMSQDPDPADAGKDMDVRWQVFNTIPGTIESLKFHLDAGYPFLFEAGNSPDIDLGPSVSTNDNQVFYVLHYKLRIADNAVKGTYNVTLNWNTGEGWTKKEFPIYIDPKRADFVVGALVTSPEKLIADAKEAKLSVNIDNIGKGNADNVKVKLLLPRGFKPTYSYSDEDSLGIIQKGSSAKANFYVDVDENIKEGEHVGKLEITYKDENDANSTYRTKTLDLVLPIKPAPYLIVETATTAPENLAAGSKAELRIKVKNTGNEKAESVSLRVFKDASQPFDFSEKSDFVGKLEPQGSGDAVLKMTVDPKAVSKKYLLDVELRGIDEKNNVLIFRRTIPITIDQKAKSAPDTGMFGTIISISSAVALFYFKRRRI